MFHAHSASRTRRALIAVATGMLALATVVASPARAAAVMSFDNLSLDQGLSQSTVFAILQDSEGFMWFGTENGLNRYDGYEFRHYERDPRSPHALHDDFIWAAVEDADANVWFGTDGDGLARWDRRSDRFTAFRHDDANPATISGNAVRALALDGHGHLWVATVGGGVDEIEPGSGKVLARYRHDDADSASLSNDEVFALRVDGEGHVWMGTNGGLNRLDPATGTMRRWQSDAQNPASLPDDKVRAVLVDHAGVVWVGTNKGGLARLRADESGFDRFRHDASNEGSLADDHVRAVFEDTDRRLWVGTDAGLELFDRDGATFAHYTHDAADPRSLADTRVVSIVQDHGGELWIGTRSGGLSKWNPRAWSFGHRRPDAREAGPEATNVTSFTEDASGRMWVGTFGAGVVAIDSATGAEQRYRHDDEDAGTLSDDRVMALLADRTGGVWAGTMGGGLNRLDAHGRVLQVFRFDPKDPRSLSADAIMALYEDARGDLWVGTFGGGVSRYEQASGNFARYPADPSNPAALASGRATAFSEDAAGAMWVGTDGGGLNVLDPGATAWRHYRHDADDAHSLSSDTVYALYRDADGTLWLGTRAGLDRMIVRGDGGVSFNNLSAKDGLANDVVYGIRADETGDLWLSTNHGLSRYNPRNNKIKSYHRADGLQAEEFNFGAHYRSRSGELYFGGGNGYNAFFPSSLALNLDPPNVVLTSIEKLNVPLATEVPYHRVPRLDLDYTDDVVTFEFAALDYAAPEHNRYAYMLEGFDSDWIDAGPLRRVTYTNLDRGHYVFRVKAANPDGAWNTTGIALPVDVAPAPWETWWANVVYAALALSLVIGIYWAQARRLAREAEYSRRLEREVKERTVQLQERNAQLTAANDQLQKASLTDALTGLRNRRFLFEEVAKDVDLVRRIHEDVRRGTRREDVADLVFIMVDLDHFKPINDTCGHAAGDEMLLQVRDALVQACRSSDYVIRWGGDEFLVVGRHSNYAESEALAERIRTRIAGKVFGLGNGQVAHTTCSIGYACYPFVQDHPDILSWEQVLGVADRAMYEAKGQRNTCVGFRATATTANCERAYQAIQQDPHTLAREGYLEIRQITPAGAATQLSA